MSNNGRGVKFSKQTNFAVKAIAVTMAFFAAEMREYAPYNEKRMWQEFFEEGRMIAENRRKEVSEQEWKTVFISLKDHFDNQGYFAPMISPLIRTQFGNCYSAALGLIITKKRKDVRCPFPGMLNKKVYKQFRKEEQKSTIDFQNPDTLRKYLEYDGVRSSITDKQRKDYFPVVGLSGRNNINFHFIRPSNNHGQELFTERVVCEDTFKLPEGSVNLLKSFEQMKTVYSDTNLSIYEQPRIFYVPRAYLGKKVVMDR